MTEKARSARRGRGRVCRDLHMWMLPPYSVDFPVSLFQLPPCHKVSQGQPVAAAVFESFE